MPIVVTYDDVAALGAAAIASGTAAGQAQTREFNARAGQSQLQMMMQATYDRWGREQQYAQRTQEQTRSLAAERQQQQAAMEGRVAVEREQTARSMYAEDERTQRALAEQQMESDQAHSLLAQRGQQDIELERIKAGLKGQEPTEADKAAAKFKQYDDEVLVPKYLMGPNANPELYKQKAQEAKMFFLGGVSLARETIGQEQDAAQYKGYGPKPVTGQQRALSGLIVGGQYGLMNEMIGKTRRPQEQYQIRADSLAMAQHAFETMPLQVLQAQLANPAMGEQMPPEIRQIAEEVVRARQSHAYPQGFAPSNQPQAGVGDFTQMSDAQVYEALLASGMRPEDIDRKYPGLR